ncbi:MAG: hypothetical protein ACOYNL_07945 [Rickettsiales bacterium]
MTKYLAALLSSTILLAIGGTANAQDTTQPSNGFSAEINAAQNFSYDSNPLRVTTGEKSLYGSTTSPELRLRWKTPVSTIESKSRVDANLYDRSEFNSVDFREDLLISRENERWTASVRGLLNYETTRESDITNYGVNLPRVHNTLVGAAPEIRFRSTPRDAWVLSAAAYQSTYDDNAYVDYNTFSISPSYEHKFDPQNIGSIALIAQRYETTSGTSLTSDSYGPSLGWVSLLTPRLTLRLNAGALMTDQSGAAAAGDQNNWNYVFSSSITYSGQQDVFDFTATRARQPFGNGTETLLDTFAVTERHAINPLIDVTAEAKYQQADYDAQPGINLDRSYTLGTGLSYKAWEQVDLTANYKYRNEELTNVTDTVEQHVVMVGFTYHPSWSGK